MSALASPHLQPEKVHPDHLTSWSIKLMSNAHFIFYKLIINKIAHHSLQLQSAVYRSAEDVRPVCFFHLF